MEEAAAEDGKGLTCTMSRRLRRDARERSMMSCALSMRLVRYLASCIVPCSSW